ncbi:MAG: hypothetical protein Tsb0020_31040 [Haliangiales bacterium]
MQRLRDDADLKPIFHSFGGDDKTRLEAITAQDSYGIAKGRIRALLDHTLTDEAEILNLLCALDEADRVAFQADREFFEQVLNHDDGAWDDAVRAAARTGSIPTSLALDYGMGGAVDGTDEAVVYDALTRLTAVERAQLTRGYILAHSDAAVSPPAEDSAALAAWEALESRLNAELSAEEKDRALVRLVGLPTPEELLDASARLQRAQLMRVRQRERMAMRHNLTAQVANTDDTMEVAHAQFLARYDQVMEDGQVGLDELSELAALNAAFDNSFTAHEAASDLAADVGAAVAAMVVGIAVAAFSGGAGAATWPALASWVAAHTGLFVASGAIVGGIASAGVAEAFGGDFRDGEDFARQGAAGAVEVVATVAAAAIAARVVGTAGLSGASLKAAIVKSTAQGTAKGLQQVGRTGGAAVLEGVIDGIIGGAMGEMVMTFTDAETFKQSLWGVVCTAGEALLRGGAMGGATAGVMATGVTAAQGVLARRLLRDVEVVEDVELGRASRIDYSADDSGLGRITFRVGNTATEADIAAHLDAVAQMQRLDRLLKRAGTLGFESEVEVEKLRRICRERLAMLAGDRLSPGTQAAIRSEIDVLEHNIEHFGRNVDNPASGAGRIGQFDAPAGYPDLPKGENGEQLYTYFKTQDGAWGVRRLELDDSTPALHLEVDETGRRTLASGLLDEGPSPTFGDGTSAKDALAQLVGADSRSSLKPLYELAKREGAIDDARLLAALPKNVAGKSEDWVRHQLKDVIKSRLLDTMFEPGGQALSAAECVARMRRMFTTELNSSDLGNLSEDWYQRFAKIYGGRPDLVKHPALPQVSAAKPRSPDFVDGDQLVEVKSTGRGLTDSDLDQLEAYLRVAKERGTVQVNGEDRTVTSLRLVFTRADGARGSMDELEKLFDDYKRVLKVEVIGSSDTHLFSDFQSLTAGLEAL